MCGMNIIMLHQLQHNSSNTSFDTPYLGLYGLDGASSAASIIKSVPAHFKSVQHYNNI